MAGVRWWGRIEVDYVSVLVDGILTPKGGGGSDIAICAIECALNVVYCIVAACILVRFNTTNLLGGSRMFSQRHIEAAPQNYHHYSLHSQAKFGGS